MMHGLTPAQSKLYDVIRTLIAEKGYSPSIDEIAERCGYKSKSGVHYRLKTLRNRGLLTWMTHCARSIRLADDTTLPPDIERALSAYCARTGDQPANVIADAVRLHLDELEQCEVAA